MTGLFKKTVLGTALAASTLAAAAPADAQYYRGYRHHGHGDTTGAAILGGILGLGVGAAIASSANDRRYRDRYYDDGYYYDRRPRVVVRERYYVPPRAYYRDGYYQQPYGYYRAYPREHYRGYYGY